jgi:hypothetical protein
MKKNKHGVYVSGYEQFEWKGNNGCSIELRIGQKDNGQWAYGTLFESYSHGSGSPLSDTSKGYPTRNGAEKAFMEQIRAVANGYYFINYLDDIISHFEDLFMENQQLSLFDNVEGF